jgi:hypothetical protein
MTLRVYVRMAVVIFSLSIVAKLLSIALVPERLVAAHGMFTFLSIRQFLFFAAVFEAGILLAVLTNGISVSSKAYVVYTAAVLFTGYHAWMISKGVSGCGCFGIFPVKALNRALDYFTYGVLLFLLVGGGVVITRETLRANAPAKET